MHFVKLLVFSILLSQTLFALDYTKKAEVQQFISKMHKKYKYNKEYLKTLFKNVRKDPLVSRKHLKVKKKKPVSTKYRPQGEWDIYSRMHLEQNQSNLGVEFMHEHRETLEKASSTYGVPAEYITAIIGIESYFGKNRGRYYVFDTLSHLAFGTGKRKRFYKYQLQEFLRMCYREQLEPRAIKGSRSGAIGMAQFLPSNYKHFAVDFNNDGKIRISKPSDAIGSVANYFKKNGWKRGEPVSTRVRYKGNRFYGLKTGYKHKYHRKDLANIEPREKFSYKKKVMLIKLEKEDYDELWYGAHNFYVITRYNHSSYYAMAVHQLAQKIKTSYYAKYIYKEGKKEKKIYLVQNTRKFSTSKIEGFSHTYKNAKHILNSTTFP